jgi:hypothetical protein
MANASVTAEKRGGGSLIWIQGLACGALAALAPAIAVQAGILLLPTLIASILDRNPGKPTARSVLLCALATCIEPLRTLWNSGHGLGDGLSALASVQVVAITWSASAGGWLLTQIIPLIAGFVLDAAASARIAHLKEKREALIREWGLDVSADQRSADTI